MLSADFFQQDKVVGVMEGAREDFIEAGFSVPVDNESMVVGVPRADGLSEVEGAAFVYPRNDSGTALDTTDDVWEQEAKLNAFDAALGDLFGWTVAISGDTIVVGSRADDLDTDGDGSIDHLVAGSVHVFTRSGSVCTQHQKLTAMDPRTNGRFGTSVAIYGNTIVVGSPGGDADTDGDGTTDVSSAGAAFVFSNSGGVWTQQQKIIAFDASTSDSFGSSVAISLVAGSTLDALDTNGDGTIDRLNAGSAYIFTRSGSIWTHQQKLTAHDADADDQFGTSVSIHDDTAVVGSPRDNSRTGSAYVFARGGSAWTEAQKLTATDATNFDRFGTSVAISADTVAIGSPCADVDTDGDGSLDLEAAGSVYTFTRNAGSWMEVQKVTAADAASGDEFGWSVAISGETVVVGSKRDDVDINGDGATDLSRAGSAYLFVRSNDNWVEQQKLSAADAETVDIFGISVAVFENTVVVGNLLDDLDTDGDGSIDAANAGSAHVFERAGGTWGEQQQLVADDAAPSDQFAWSVAISGNTIVGGSNGDDLDTNGDGVSDRSSIGSAYVFHREDA